jgi:hypothetical protein
MTHELIYQLEMSRLSDAASVDTQASLRQRLSDAVKPAKLPDT